MAKIQLILSVDDAGELQDILSQLAGYTLDHSTGVESNVYQEHILVTPEPEAKPPAGDQSLSYQQQTAQHQTALGEQKKRPGRPGRPAKAAESPVAPVSPATAASGGGTEAGTPSTGSATTTADPFTEQIKRSALTAADVKQAGAEYMKAHSVADSMALIKKIAGVEAFAQVPEDKYEELYAALKAG